MSAEEGGLAFRQLRSRSLLARSVTAQRLREFPLRDAWLRGRRLHRNLYWTWWESREVRRLRRLVGELPEATVAVVLSTYRRPELLREAVSSVLAQTRPDFVVIVVDDGGGQADGLPDDPRLHTVRLSRNTRVLGVVTNIGIRLTRSRYVAILNDDNRWRPNHLEQAIGALEAGADLVYTAMRRHRVDGSDVDELAVPFDRDALRRSFFTDSNTLVIRRVKGLHWDRTPRGKRDTIKEDWEFVWRYSRRMRTKLVPVVTVDYLIHDDSYLTDWSSFWQSFHDS